MLMYKVLIFIVFGGLYTTVMAQYSNNELNTLISKEQYSDAFELLNQKYQSDSLELILAQSAFVLDYYASSYYHRSFGFVNLRPGETLEEIRKSEQYNSTQWYLPVDSLLMQQIELHPSNFRLQLQLAKYYNAVFLQFGDRWGRKSEWLLDQSQYYFVEAYKNGVYDYYSLYAIGYFNTLTENYHEARYWFNKSLQLKEDALTHYNLAVSCLLDGMFSEGVTSAARAYEMYTDSLKKGDAARITGILYGKLEQNEEALSYFIKANNLSPDYKPNQLYLLKSYLHANRFDEAAALARELVEQNIYSPDLLQELLDMFKQEEQQEMLKKIFGESLEQADNDAEAFGNLLFHMAKLEYEMGHKGKTKRLLKKSRDHFSRVFDEGHQVFQAIDQMLYHL